MTNPYQAPEAALEPEGQAPGRPAWVWIICLFYGMGVVSSAIMTPLLLTDALPVPDPQGEQLEQIGALGYGLMLLSTVLMGAFVVQLYRLRASAVALCTACLALSLANAAWQLLAAGLPAGFGWISVATSAFSVGLLLLVLLYTVRLRRHGVLH